MGSVREREEEATPIKYTNTESNCGQMYIQERE